MRFRVPGFVFSNSPHDWLLISSAFSCLMLLARFIITGSGLYFFLPWNLFLAFIPYLVSGLMIRCPDLKGNRLKIFTGFIVWLLFIPNSFYIVTDLFHLSRHHSAPKWFDLLMLFSFAWNGMQYGIISLVRMETITVRLGWKKFSLVFVAVVMWLCAWGIYIGRYLRFNSWDIIADPFSLVSELMEMILNPFDFQEAWGMTLCYSIFMTIFYLTIRKVSETLKTEKRFPL